MWSSPRAAQLLALDALLNGSAGGSCNPGTDSDYSVREVLTAIERGLQVTAVGWTRAGNPPILVADPTAAKAELNFFPAHSDIATIVRSVWQWHLKALPKKRFPARRYRVMRHARIQDIDR
jgi:UDP-glucose 4-epimerase